MGDSWTEGYREMARDRRRKRKLKTAIAMLTLGAIILIVIICCSGCIPLPVIPLLL